MWETTMYDTTKKTIELREIIESGVDLWNHPTVITAGYRPKIGKNLDMFLTELRKQKLINHYWFRQIGQETVGRFLHMFGTKLSEVIPYYEELYDSVVTMWELDDPFANVDVIETFEQETTNTTSSKGSASNSVTGSDSATNSNTRRYSNTPQGEISNIEKYMTEATVENGVNSQRTTSTNSGSSQDSSEGSGTVKHTFRKTGNQGVNTYAHDMNEFRTSILRIEEQFIAEFNCLFLGVY